MYRVGAKPLIAVFFGAGSAAAGLLGRCALLARFEDGLRVLAVTPRAEICARFGRPRCPALEGADESTVDNGGLDSEPEGAGEGSPVPEDASVVVSLSVVTVTVTAFRANANFFLMSWILSCPPFLKGGLG